MIESLPVIPELERATAQGPARRAEMLDHVTSLFAANAARLSEVEIALFDDVILRLARDIEVAARALLAERLAEIANAPPRVILALAEDDAIEVAGPVLTRSARLDDPALAEAARTRSQRHLLAISGRQTLGEIVTDVLVERGDCTVVMATVANTGARFSEQGFSTLVRRSNGHDAIAASVGRRPELPAHLFLRLLASASEGVRRKLQAENPRASREIDEVVAKVAERMRADALGAPDDYDDAEVAVAALAAAGELNEARLAHFAASGQFEAATIAFARLCDLPKPLVESAMTSDRPELVLIFSRAAGFAWPTVKTILRLRAAKSGVTTGEIEHCLASFERLRPATAQQLVRFHRLNAANAKSARRN